MAKNYQDYCRDAVARDPKTYGNCFNLDGTRKKMSKMIGFGSKMYNPPKEEKLSDLEKDGWKPPKVVSKAGAKRSYRLTILGMPENPTRKVYNRIWMHNYRAKIYLKKLKE